MKNPRNWNIGSHRTQVEELRQKLKNINVNFKNSNRYTNLRQQANRLIYRYLQENLGLSNFHQNVMRKLNLAKERKRQQNINNLQRSINFYQRKVNTGEHILTGGQGKNHDPNYVKLTQNQLRNKMRNNIREYKIKLNKLKRGL
jgi:hypothetical protein